MRRLVLILAAVMGLLSLAPEASVRAYPSTEVTLSGRGFGHGRGLGQWGALGYAIDAGWTYRTILDHYYGGTQPATKPDGLLGVRLVALDGASLMVTSGAPFTIGPYTVAANSAARLVRRTDGAYDLFTRYGCEQGDAWYGGVVDPLFTSTVADPQNDITKLLTICQPDGNRRGYRGQLRVVPSDGIDRIVNIVTMEQYLRGVVPRESPASWAGEGGGRGAEALKAQAVAARSYAWSEGGESGQRYSFAKTCDTTTCQVYGGAALNGTPLEDSRTDAAIAATANEVRRFGTGTLARTEFSASTGGWTAPNSFPAVEDKGDSRSPYHSWTVKIPVTTIENAYKVGTLQSIVVTKRNGLGEGGGRVVELRISGSAATVTVTGNDFRSKIGLRSDWFFVIDSTPPPGSLGWYQRELPSTGPADNVFPYGGLTDIGFACDWDANATDSPVVFRSGVWHLRASNNLGVADAVFSYGNPTDTPLCGDWDGDGRDSPGIFRAGSFYLRNSNTTGVAELAFGFGNPTDVPIVGDWDGDGRDTIGVFRGNVFYLRNSNTTGVAEASFAFGNPSGDRPVVGDWDGAGAETIGIYRAGVFYLRNLNSPGVAQIVAPFGIPTDRPIVGDWNGDGVDGIGVARRQT